MTDRTAHDTATGLQSAWAALLDAAEKLGAYVESSPDMLVSLVTF